MTKREAEMLLLEAHATCPWVNCNGSSDPRSNDQGIVCAKHHAAIDAAVAAARREGHAQNCVCGTQFTSYLQEATRSVLDPRCLAFWEGKS